MSLLRKRRGTQSDTQSEPDDAVQERAVSGERAVGYNPDRDAYLFWYTEDGYIIAQDVMSQYEYIADCTCGACGGAFKVVAHLNRAGQGLSEMVAICQDCGQRANFIFDISNDVFQSWWAEQLGALYIRQFDGPPRTPYSPD